MSRPNKGNAAIQVLKISGPKPVQIKMQLKQDGQTTELNLTRQSATLLAHQLLEVVVGLPRSDHVVEDKQIGIFNQVFGQMDSLFKYIFGSKK